MNEYILFMHGDAPAAPRHQEEAWTAYFAKLSAAGVFQGGSAIGDGSCVSKAATPAAVTRHIAGYIRVRADSLAAARDLVVGNPVYEAGGTVEIRELPKTG